MQNLKPIFFGILQIVVMELLKGTDTVKFTATPNYGPVIDEPKAFGHLANLAMKRRNT